MCPTMVERNPSAAEPPTKSAATTDVVDWREETIKGGSLRHVDLHTGSNGWASPPGNLFPLRSKHYFSKKTKSPAGHYLLKPTAVDWLRSLSKLEHVLSRPDNRVIHALSSHCSNGNFIKTFVFAVNLQVPGRDHYSAVFYFSTEEPIQPGSLLDRFINGDDNFRNQRFKLVNRIVKGPWIVKKSVGNYSAYFRNQRFKLVNRIVKGPWIVKKSVGNYSACLLGKALTCRNYRGQNYLEIDVDIASSKIARALLHLALGCVTTVTIDMGFVVEAQVEEELPESLVGAVRICQMEMSSATYVDCSGSGGVGDALSGSSEKRLGIAKVNNVDGVKEMDSKGADF